MRTTVKLLVMLLILPCILYSQGRFEFEFDYAQFAYDSSSNYTELYYSFGQNSLLKVESDTSVSIEGILQIEIRDSITNDIYVDNEWKISHKIIDTSNKDNSLVGVISFILPKGKYKCTVTGKDSLESNAGREYTEYISVEPFIGENISISDLQLASNILQDSPNANSIFFKNSYEVVPLPTSVFGENQPVLFLYMELYNLNEIEHDDPLKLNTLVFNSKGNAVFNKTKLLKSSHNSRVEVGSVVVSKFPTDTYTLVAALIDSTGNYGVSSSKRFYVYNPSVEPDETETGGITDAFATHFGVMSEEELDDLFDKSKYIANAKEIDQYKKISSLQGKREFLHQFWSARDFDPSTARNEFFFEYLERIKISDQRFGSMGKNGWKTDRGRVYLVYGEPSEIERYPNQIDSKPYEIWYYNEMEGGVIFVFADLTNFSDYQLIHSTARGELRDDSWFRRIRSI
jgi:GWxTD domain-containing protein